ncbi:MAG: formylglycine-generating enzyme family protein [Nitrospina sp.]|nr:MAG: formylglycine-generating enzyme family protein [Nitrospina sp.]
MSIFRVVGILVLLVGPLACSQSDSGKQQENPPSIAEIEGTGTDSGQQALQGVVPIVLSEKDQARAKRAPEGMVFIKGGCFTMGNDRAQADEKYEHEVCLDDFYLDRYKVTQARWTPVMGFNPSKITHADHPVEQVNYHDIQQFIEKSGGTCRLPTEAEWEYAARGHAKTRYFWGNLMDGAYAWFEDNSDKTTHPVGQKKPNQFGLYDMMGNVWEWTEDWYSPYYVGNQETNPQGPAKGENKVIRGGSFNSSAGALRITNRTWLNPKNRVFSKVASYGGSVDELYNYIGFRCAQSITAPPAKASPALTTEREKPAQG